jgi:DNA-binding transcriptional LysR family regulator
MTERFSVNFHRLRVFRAVARQRSFTRAAEALYTSQPNVSRHVAQLEAELGTILFHRLGNTVELTDAGRIVYDYAHQVFALTESMRRALSELEGLERGYLRLGASSTPGHFLLPPIVASFQKMHPGLEITLQITNTQGVVERVLNSQVDMGFVESPVTTRGLQAQPYTTDELVPIAAPSHPLAHLPVVRPEDLCRETLVLREEGSGTRQVVEEVLSRWKVQPRRVLIINGCEGVKQVVAAGLGVSFVPLCAIELERTHGLIRVLSGEEMRLARSLSIIVRKDTRPPAATLAFLAHVRKGD